MRRFYLTLRAHPKLSALDSETRMRVFVEAMARLPATAKIFLAVFKLAMLCPPFFWLASGLDLHSATLAFSWLVGYLLLNKPVQLALAEPYLEQPDDA